MSTALSNPAAGAQVSLTAPSRREMEEVIRQIRGNSLYNRQLSSICQVNGLKSTGVKADLQRRITDRTSHPPCFHLPLTLPLGVPFCLPFTRHALQQGEVLG